MTPKSPRHRVWVIEGQGEEEEHKRKRLGSWQNFRGRVASGLCEVHRSTKTGFAGHFTLWSELNGERRWMEPNGAAPLPSASRPPSFSIRLLLSSWLTSQLPKPGPTRSKILKSRSKPGAQDGKRRPGRPEPTHISIDTSILCLITRISSPGRCEAARCRSRSILLALFRRRDGRLGFETIGVLL